MYAHNKTNLSILEIENLKLHGCSKSKTPIELVSDKLIISPYGLNTTNSPRQIDHPKCKYWQNTPLFWMSYSGII